MRLYLASHNLGPYTNELLKLTGEERAGKHSSLRMRGIIIQIKSAQMICEKK